MTVPVTTLYAAVLALLFVALSARVILYRKTSETSLGDGGDPTLLTRVRAQGNCAEYVPLGILLLGLAELNGTPAAALHLLGLMLLLGRVIHAWAFLSAPPVLPLRVAGMGLTLAMLITTALGLLGHALL